MVDFPEAYADYQASQLSGIVFGQLVIGDIVFKEGEPDPVPEIAYSGKHRVLEVPINGFADVTIPLSGDGSSDHPESGSLIHLTISARSITERRFRELWKLVKRKGPYMVRTPAEDLNMYLIDWSMKNAKGELRPPYPIGEEPNFVATWDLKFTEEHD
jgi:hypothetical protein